MRPIRLPEPPIRRRSTAKRVTRPRGGINEWLHWLPVSLHKKVDYIIRQICSHSRFQMEARGNKMVPFSVEKTDNYAFGSQIICLSNLLEADAKQIAMMARDTFERDGPLLVVASGRDTISVASSIKRLATENIQHPRSRLNMFDLVITHHDYYPLTPHAQKQIPWFLQMWITPREPPDRHVVLTVESLHLPDSVALRSAASVWHDELAPLAKPLLVVNIGGPTSSCQYGVDLAKQLTAILQNVLWSCGSIRISFLRRTPEKEFSTTTNIKVYIWDGEGPNPRMGHLAWADAFLITADSVSMLSEACTTGKPVYVVGAERCTWKFTDFQNSLRERGVIHPFTGKEDISESWSYPPLNDTADAASEVIKALAERGWTIRT
ncbi:hypothetical protein CRYUN_Cryun05aG0216200 [Craigia yunnanensis]